MLSNTLGGLIKDYRLQKRISQMDVSLKLGWKDTTRLSKIEQGRVSKPKRETIDRVIAALGMSEPEKGYFLYNSGYLPNDKEIQDAFDEVRERLDAWLYPAYLMDFSFRMIYCNIPDFKAVNMPIEGQEEFNNLRMNILELPFLPEEIFGAVIEKGEDEKSLKPFAEAQILAFKTENLRFQNESWYKNLIKKLSKNEKFRKLWVNINPEENQKKLYDYEFKKSTFTKNGKKIVLKFHIFTSKVVKYPQLQVVLYQPADQTTKDYFSKS